MRAGVVAVLALLVLAACATPIDPQILERILAVNASLDGLQLKTAVSTFSTLRSTIADREFPVVQFDVSLSRMAKDAEQAVAQMGAKASTFVKHWKEVSAARTIEDAFESQKIMYAIVELVELSEDVGTMRAFLPEMRQRVESLRASMASYTPANPLEKAFEDWGVYVRLSLLLAFLSIPMWFVVKALRYRLLFLPLVIVVFVLVAFCGHLALGGVWGMVAGPPLPVALARGLLEEGSLTLARFASAFGTAEEAINLLRESCDSIDKLNSTLNEALSTFSKHISDITASSPHGQVTQAEVAQRLVNTTRESLRNQRVALMKSSHEGKLKGLLDMIDYFELMLTQTNLGIYVNLRAGGNMNAYLAANLGKLLEYIDAGNLRECLLILEAIYRQQKEHFEALHAANQFLRTTNDAIDRIRRENTRLQPEFATLEFDAWLKRMASTIGTAGSVVGVPAVALLGGTAGVAMAPTAAVTIAIAALGYHWSNAYGKAEGEAKSVMRTLSEIDKTLHATEETLTNHENTLVLLMADVESVLRTVNRSETRFRLVREGRIFTTQEVSLLRTGVNRIIDAVDGLADRYSQAADRMDLEASSASRPVLKHLLPARDATGSDGGALPQDGHREGEYTESIHPE